jgi:hypothetical protein
MGLPISKLRYLDFVGRLYMVRGIALRDIYEGLHEIGSAEIVSSIQGVVIELVKCE